VRGVADALVGVFQVPWAAGFGDGFSPLRALKTKSGKSRPATSA